MKEKQLTNTQLFAPWSGVIAKLTGSQLVMKFPAFYGNRSFVTAFPSTCDVSVSAVLTNN